MLSFDDSLRPAPIPSVPALAERPQKSSLYGHYMRKHPEKGWQYFSNEFQRWETLGFGRCSEPYNDDVVVEYAPTKGEPEEL